MIRTIIIGDIHGCCRELMGLMEKITYDPSCDRLISLGDLMDRGKESYEVYQFFRHLKEKMGDRCVIIRGNHEQMMMDAAGNPFGRELWKMNGGIRTIRSFYQHQDRIYRHAVWFRSNTVLTYEDEWFQCVHAGLAREGFLKSSPDDFLWDRERIERNDYSGKLTIVGHTPSLDAVWYAGDGNTAKILPERKRMALPETGLICLDTGCVYGFRLSAMVIEGREFWLDSYANKSLTS